VIVWVRFIWSNIGSNPGLSHLRAVIYFQFQKDWTAVHKRCQYQCLKKALLHVITWSEAQLQHG
jgi:hypothetical protein